MGKITDILGDLQTYSWDKGRGTYDMSDDTKAQESEEAILALIAEAIGEDEDTRVSYAIHGTKARNPKKIARNELRAEIRKRLGL